MQNIELIKYGRYLSALIASAILNTDPPAPFDDIDWEKLLYLSQRHSVSVMIYPVIKDMELPQNIKQKFNNIKDKMLARTTRQTIESERIFSLLEQNGIKYIKLKGSHIKDYYPVDYMRTFDDIDICLSKDDREKAKPLMESAGYTLQSSVDYHDEYSKDNFYIYELHSALVPESSHYYSVFDKPFSKAVAENNSNMSYVLNNEYFYLNLFFHLHKHFTTTGCGIRLFADLLVFEKNIKDVDYNYIKSVLKQYNMMDFYNTVQNLIGYFFFGKDANDKTLAIAEYILENNASGLYKTHVANYGFWGKVSYMLKMWFPSAKDLAFRYPVLNKAPILLPVCWVRRFFYSLFFKRSAIKKQADNINTISSNEYKKIKNVRKLAEKK